MNRNTAMLIHIFEKDKDHSWEDVWLENFNALWEYDYKLYKEATEQFIKQLEGDYCIEALRDKCNEVIQEDKIRCEAICNNLRQNEGSSDK